MNAAFASLDDLPRWVAWRNEIRGRKGLPTKVPYGIAGREAKANDATTWVARPEAEKLAKRLVNGLGGGIGFELGDIGSDTIIAGLDLDSCLAADGTIAPWASAIIDAVFSYAETSPSGTGIKLFFYIAAEDIRPFLDRIGVAADQWGCRRAIAGEDPRNHGPAIEFYAAGRYFAVTERHWPTSPARIAAVDSDTLDRLAALIPPQKSGANGSVGATGDGSRSAIALKKGAALRRSGKTFEEMCEALRDDSETAAWCREKGDLAGGRELRRIWDKAEPHTDAGGGEGVSLGDFYAHMPMHSYIYTPARDMWPAGSVNARIPPLSAGDTEIKANTWLDQNRPVEQMTWAPGLPMIIPNRLIAEGGWIERDGVSCFNLYRPPRIKPGDAAQAGPWLDHLKKVYPDDAPHIVKWLAHRVQHAETKLNHALVLGGKQGIGKDTIVEPAKHAIGPWNFFEISPQQALGRFNGFLKSVILRINEARDLGESDRFKFYDHMKAVTAAPPDVLRVDEKNLREHSVLNCCGVIITTNEKTNGIYLPADDRRHYVAWSDLSKEIFSVDYWNELWGWYERGGFEHVAAYLAEFDLSGFDPKAPPPKTPAFWEIVDASRNPADAELADAIDQLSEPDTVTLQELANVALSPFAEWLIDRKNSRFVPHRLEECGYVAVRNPGAQDGLWKINGKRQVIYAKAEIPSRERFTVAAKRGRGW